MLMLVLTALLSSPAQAESQAVSEALRLQGPAVEVLEVAYENTRNPRWKRLAQTLERARIRQGLLCRGRVAARAIPFSGGIGICNGFMSYVYRGDLQGIGTLIHEALHLIGQVDECRADQEVNEILWDAGLGKYRGAYC